MPEPGGDEDGSEVDNLMAKFKLDRKGDARRVDGFGARLQKPKSVCCVETRFVRKADVKSIYKCGLRGFRLVSNQMISIICRF